MTGLLRSIGGLLPLVVVLAALCCCAPCGLATIRYDVSLAHPEQHLFAVTITIPDVQNEITVQMPAWNALYQIRDFSAHVAQVAAFVDGRSAPIEKLDKQTWRVTGSGTITLRYNTYWDEPGPFAAQLNGEHAFINPAMILMYAPERRAEAVRLCLAEAPQDWRTTLRLGEGGPDAANSCRESENYDALADAPVEAGKFEEFVLPDVKPTIHVVIHGDNYKKKRVEEQLARICRYELKLMEGAPFKNYTFILHIGKAATGSGGGMEHANGTAINAPSDEYLEGVAAHEFFHLWNVKRIRPASLEPVDYTKEQYTRALWFAEGVTSTYASYTLVRAGLWNKQQFYEDLGQQITELEGRPAEAWQSAEQSSLDAWLEKYALYGRPEESVSYYTKGQVLGVLLDISIRDRTQNRASLDDVLREMNTNFAKASKTYHDSQDVRLTAEKVGGGSFEDFFSRYVAGADALPYKQILGLAGLDLRTVEHRRGVLGFFAERDASGAILVRSVEDSGGATQAGLRVNDVIVSWNGGDMPRHLDRWVAEQKPGSTLHLRIRREEKESNIDVILGEMKDVRYEITETPHAAERARVIRDGLLHGTTSPSAGQ
ncbi:MAG TPA: PDZ domain-containing protein [Candidatus Acidoferrum sp.]|nr:PDZ domain-containing protein [Candidatus Acidoferrum sp.]